MRALKLLVIVLGLLLLTGMGALTVAVVWRFNHVGPTSTAKSTSSTVQRIVVPPGAKVVGTEVNAGRLVVRIDMSSGAVRLLVFDLATGEKITTIELAPPAP